LFGGNLEPKCISLKHWSGVRGWTRGFRKIDNKARSQGVVVPATLTPLKLLLMSGLIIGRQTKEMHSSELLFG
jgi:hypothetical protein